MDITSIIRTHLGEYNGDGSDLEVAIEAIQTDVNAIFAEKKYAAETDDLVEKLLKSADMNGAAIPKALLLYDRNLVVRNGDGSICNIDEVLDYFKSEWADFFMKKATKGSNPAFVHSGAKPATDPFIEGFRSVK
jgi:hypothetical protein